MPRKSVLEDRLKRNRVIRVLTDGGTEEDAAKEVGTTYQSLYRYCAKNPEFKDRMERAKAKAAGKSSEIPAVEPPPPIVPPPNPPSQEAVLTQQMTGVDADLWDEAVDDWLGDDLTELHSVVGLETPSPRKFMMVCWHRGLKDPVNGHRWFKMIQPAMLVGPMRAQERRDAAAERRAMAEEQAQIAEKVSQGNGDGVTSGEGMVVVEVPPNKARPFLSRPREVIEAEVVE